MRTEGGEDGHQDKGEYVAGVPRVHVSHHGQGPKQDVEEYDLGLRCRHRCSAQGLLHLERHRAVGSALRRRLVRGLRRERVHDQRAGMHELSVPPAELDRSSRVRNSYELLKGVGV